MNSVGERLAELEEAGEVDLSMLQQNEEFISAVMHASALAIRSHQQEKLEALRNAVANTAKGQAPEDAVLHMYLMLVDDLSTLQIQILTTFQSPTAPPGMSMGGLNYVLEHSLPHLRGKQHLYSQLWSDLSTRGLLQGGLNVTMSGSGLAEKRTTLLADGFLKFISP